MIQNIQNFTNNKNFMVNTGTELIFKNSKVKKKNKIL